MIVALYVKQFLFGHFTMTSLFCFSQNCQLLEGVAPLDKGTQGTRLSGPMMCSS